MSTGVEVEKATGRAAEGRENGAGLARRPGVEAESPQVAAETLDDLGSGGCP